MSGYSISQKVDMEGRKIYDDKLFRQAMGRLETPPIEERVISNVNWKKVGKKHWLCFYVNSYYVDGKDRLGRDLPDGFYYIVHNKKDELLSRQYIFSNQDKWVRQPDEDQGNPVDDRPDLCTCKNPSVHVRNYICSICNKVHPMKYW